MLYRGRIVAAAIAAILLFAVAIVALNGCGYAPGRPNRPSCCTAQPIAFGFGSRVNAIRSVGNFVTSLFAGRNSFYPNRATRPSTSPMCPRL